MDERKILITGPSWIGDMVMAQSLFKWIKTHQPEIRIDVLAPAWTFPVVQRMPEISRTIPFNSRHGKLDLGMRLKTGKVLKQENYDEAIIIPRTLKAALPALVAGIKKRTGYKSNFGVINNVRPFRKNREELFVRRYLSLVTDEAYRLDQSQVPQPRLNVDLQQVDALLQQHQLIKNRFVVFAPGAEYGPAKLWPAQHFAELALMLEEKGLQAVIMGSEKEQQLATNILELSDAQNMINLCGKTSLGDVVDIMSAAHSVVANDSGLMHLAYASGSYVFAIYGSSSARYTPPLSATAEVLQYKVDCQPCFARTCRFGHYDCLQNITPSQVINSSHFGQI